jgi:hypothetical protein
VRLGPGGLVGPRVSLLNSHSMYVVASDFRKIASALALSSSEGPAVEVESHCGVGSVSRKPAPPSEALAS